MLPEVVTVVHGATLAQEAEALEVSVEALLVAEVLEVAGNHD